MEESGQVGQSVVRAISSARGPPAFLVSPAKRISRSKTSRSGRLPRRTTAAGPHRPCRPDRTTQTCTTVFETLHAHVTTSLINIDYWQGVKCPRLHDGSCARHPDRDAGTAAAGGAPAGCAADGGAAWPLLPHGVFTQQLVQHEVERCGRL